MPASSDHQQLRVLGGAQQGRHGHVGEHFRGEDQIRVPVGELALDLLQDVIGALGLGVPVLDHRAAERCPQPGVDHVQGQVTPYGLPCGPVRRGPALRGSVHSDYQGALHDSVLRTDAGASGSVGRGNRHR